MDKKGYHALHCKYGKQLILRHNIIRDEINKQLIKAGYITKIEQKYKYTDSNQCTRIDGVPGDIYVDSWDNESGGRAYFDVTVANIFAKSYVKKASMDRLAIAKLKENEKKEKYENMNDIIPLAVEVMGGIGNSFKKCMQQIADKIALRKNQPYGIVINRLRAKIIAVLMKQNAKMILSAIEL